MDDKTTPKKITQTHRSTDVSAHIRSAPLASSSSSFSTAARHDKKSSVAESISFIDSTGAIRKDYSVDYGALKFIRRLGSGTFAEVWLGKYNNEEVAIKRFVKEGKMHFVLTAKEHIEVRQEASVMAAWDSQYLVRLKGLCLTKAPYCLIMECLPQGDLLNVLSRSTELAWDTRLQIASDISCGLSLLHQRGIWHRDLKSRNILLSNELRAKVSDFGLVSLKNAIGNTSPYGTIHWAAPELFRAAKFSAAADVYALGIVLWELATRKLPFTRVVMNKKGISCEQVLAPAAVEAAIRRGEHAWNDPLTLDMPLACPAKFTTLIRDCCQENPALRPTASKVADRLMELLPSTSRSSAVLLEESPYSQWFNTTTLPYEAMYRNLKAVTNQTELQAVVEKTPELLCDKLTDVSQIMGFLSYLRSFVPSWEVIDRQIEAVKEDDGDSLAKRQLALDQQVFTEERQRCQNRWQQQKILLSQQPPPHHMTVIVALQSEVLADLAFALQWSPTEKATAFTYLDDLWEHYGFAALMQAVKVAQEPTQHRNTWLLWQTQLQQQLTQLIVQGHPTLAKQLAERNAAALRGWSASLTHIHQQQQKQHQQTQAAITQLIERQQQWHMWLTTKCTAMGFTSSMITTPIRPSSASVAEDYAHSDIFVSQLQQCWEQGDLRAFKRDVQRFELAWRSAAHQGRNNAAKIHYQALGISLQAAITALNACYTQQEQPLTQQQEKRQTQLTTWQQTLDMLHTTQSQLAQLEVMEITKSLPDEKKSPSPTRVFATEEKEQTTESKPALSDKTATFWPATHTAIQEIEQQLGAPPCAYVVLAWPVDSPGQLQGQWQWGLLLDSIPTSTDRYAQCYWHVFSRLLQGRLSILQALAPVGLDWSNDTLFSALTTPPVKTIAAEHLLPYRHAARTLGNSTHILPAGATLASRYQHQAIQALSATTPTGVTKSRCLGVQGLQTTFSQQPTALLASIAIDIHQMLLLPLLRCCRDMASYYGIPPNGPATILTTLQERGDVSGAFITDLQAALSWTYTQCQTSSAESDLPSTLLVNHYDRTVGLLAQTYHHWSEATPPAAAFDPLAQLCQHLMLQLTSESVTDTQEHIQYLGQAMQHRPTLQQISWHIPLFLGMPQTTQLAYLQALKHALPDDKQADSSSLIHRLRHTPTPSGRRVTWTQEQADWQQHVLPRLWSVKAADTLDLQESSSSPTTEAKTTVTVTPLFSVSVVRQVLQEGIWQWQIQTHSLPPEIVDQLFLPDGQWRPKDEKIPGNHRVFPIRIDGAIQLWAKVYPEQPAIEYVVQQLDRRLGGNGTPCSELVKIHHGPHTSPVLVSQAVAGRNLQEVLKKEPELLGKIDFASFAHTLLRVLLTNPEDDKPDDYFLVEQDGLYNLVRIDNERAFYAPLVATQRMIFQSTTTLQVKSVIYFLEQMRWNWYQQPAANIVLANFVRIQPIPLLAELLSEATQHHTAWGALFSLEEVHQHFSRPPPEQGLSVFFMPPDLIRELITRLTAMQTVVRMSQKHGASLTGLQLLEATQPQLAQFYSKAHPTPLEIKTPILREGADPSAEQPDPVVTQSDHRHVKPRFEQAMKPWYAKSSEGGFQSHMLSSQAIQTSLRTALPVNATLLLQIYEAKAYSPKQEAQAFDRWQHTHLEELAQQLLQPQEAVLKQLQVQHKQTLSILQQNALWQNHQEKLIADFQQLPLRHRQAIWRQWLKPALVAKKLPFEQQVFLLRALTGADWQILDFSVFASQLITDTAVTAVLKGSKQPILSLNINGCIDLTIGILTVIQQQCPYLKYLSCSHLVWEYIRLEGFKELVSFQYTKVKVLQTLYVDRVPQLRTLDLSNSSLVTLSGTAPQLQTLNLENCVGLQRIGETGFLQNSLFSAPQLTQFHITGCNQLASLCVSKTMLLNRIFVRPLFSCASLQTIDFQTDTGVWIHVPDFLVGPVKSGRVTNFFGECGEKQLTPDQFTALQGYLAYDRFLTSLDLWQNDIGAGGAQVLGEVLKTNTTLISLGLWNNNIGTGGAQAFAEMLRTNITLVNLDLGANNIGAEGAQALAKMLKTNITLVSLELAHNNIGTEGAYALAGMLKTNTTLVSLDLSNNNIGTEGVQVLAKTLKTNTTLTHLDFGWKDNIDHATKLEIKGYLARNRELQKSAKPTRQPTQLPLPILPRLDKKGDVSSSASSAHLLTATTYTDVAASPSAERKSLTSKAQEKPPLESTLTGLSAPHAQLFWPLLLSLTERETKSISGPLITVPVPDVPLSETSASATASTPTLSDPPSPSAMTHTLARERKRSIDRTAKPPSPPPVWYAPHSQFLSPTPLADEKAQALLKDTYEALDRVYPAHMVEHSDIRQAHVLQLEEYQSRGDALTPSERKAIGQLLTALQEARQQRSQFECESP